LLDLPQDGGARWLGDQPRRRRHDAESARREKPRPPPCRDARAGPSATRSKAERRFCLKCGSALWLWDPHWPAPARPHTSAIDTPLPRPPEV